MRISLAGLFLFVAFLVAGCGGGGSSGGGADNDGGGGGGDSGSSSPGPLLIVSEWDYPTREDHRMLSMISDPATGDFVGDEYLVREGSPPLLVGGFSRLDGIAVRVQLNEEGLPAEFAAEDGSRIIFSDYGIDSVTARFFMPDGNLVATEKVALDPSALTAIRQLYLGAELVTPLSSQISAAQERTLRNTGAAVVSLGINAVGCKVAVATTVASWGLASPWALASCTSAALSGAALVAGPGSEASVLATEANQALCVLLDVSSCLALVVDSWGEEPESVQIAVEMHGEGRGSVTSRPVGLDCSCQNCSCAQRFVLNGDIIRLEAKGGPGSAFFGWEGACMGFSPTCELGATQDLTARANFVTLEVSHILSVGKSGSGSGTVTSTPAGINCGSTCSASFPNNQSVTLTATSSTGSTFAGWSGACAGSSATCAVTMSQTESVTASFNSIVGMNRTTNLLAHYSFDEGEGFVIRDAVGGRDFRSSTSDIWSNSGVVGSALEILGRTDVSITRAPDLDFSMPLGTKISLSGWIMRTKGGTTQVILSRGRNTLAEPSLVWLFTTDDNLAFSYCPVSPNLCNIWRSHEPLTQVNVWQHFALTYTYGLGESLAAYRNGQRLSGAWAVGGGNVTPANENNGLRIGSQLDANDNPIAPLEGHIDELMLWKGRILTGDEVSALHMNP